MVEYARERTRVHITNFNHLYETIMRNEVDEGWLSEIERRHNVFPEIDYRIYC
jgi:1,4-alpha-glucan branching enzyme